MILLDAPKWTDEVIAIATLLAVPGALTAFIMLFRKDKVKEEQISKLTSIASSMEQQIDELKIQNFHLSRYNELFKEYTERQLQMQTDDIEMQREREKLANLPWFRSTNNQSSGLHILTISFVNRGELAKDILLGNNTQTNSAIVVSEFTGERTIPKNSQITIRLQSPSGTNVRSCLYTFRIEFKDIMGNEYYQEISGGGENLNLNISNPEPK